MAEVSKHDYLANLEQRMHDVMQENARLQRRVDLLSDIGKPNLDQPYQTIAEQHLKSYVQNGFAARYMLENGELNAQRRAFEQLRSEISQEVNALVRARWEENLFSMEKVNVESMYQEHASKKQAKTEAQ